MKGHSGCNRHIFLGELIRTPLLIYSSLSFSLSSALSVTSNVYKSFMSGSLEQPRIVQVRLLGYVQNRLTANSTKDLVRGGQVAAKPDQIEYKSSATSNRT